MARTRSRIEKLERSRQPGQRTGPCPVCADKPRAAFYNATGISLGGEPDPAPDDGPCSGCGAPIYYAVTFRFASDPSPSLGGAI